MLEIKNVEVHGLDRAMLASGNPMTIGEINTASKEPWSAREWDKISERTKKLGSSKSGHGHDNFLKGIIVQFDVKYPQYWTPEAQRYHWLDIISSQSKMHRLTTVGSNNEFALMFNKYVDPSIIERVQDYIRFYNNDTPIAGEEDTKYYWFMKALSNLPMGYEMWETISTNYLQLKTVYKQRKGHKLREDWGAFIKMCDDLPSFIELTELKKE